MPKKNVAEEALQVYNLYISGVPKKEIWERLNLNERIVRRRIKKVKAMAI